MNAPLVPPRSARADATSQANALAPGQSPSSFRLHDGELYCEELALAAIAQQFGTPTYVYSRAALEAAWDAFASAANHRSTLICYAVKANSNLAILEVLARRGAGFDIVSGGELERVLAIGGDPHKIVFSGVGKTVAEIEQALACGVKCFNVESEAELTRIDAIARAAQRRAPVSIRVNPDVDAGTHPYISTGLRQNKFGIAHERARAVYRHAMQLSGLDVIGIDCHIGSQIVDTAPFLDALDRVLALADELEADGLHLRHLDLGGGLGICYQHETPPERAHFLQSLLDRVDAWRERGAGRAHVQVLFEFGRALVGEAGTLLTRVEYLKDNGEQRFAIVDAAMNDLMRPALYDAWHPVVAVRARADCAPQTYDLVGPVCESGDWLARGRSLALAEGDLLAIGCAGAYGMAMASNYNSRPRAAEVLIDGKQCHLIRRRESVQDLFAHESRLPARQD
jgi:diaminopimelate decarboxylase